MSTAPIPFDLLTALKAAKPDDTITIPAGEYGPVSIGKLTFDPPVTVRGPEAVLARLNVTECAGLVFEDLTVRLAVVAATPASTEAVRAWKCRNIAFRRLTVRGGVAVGGLDPATPPSSAALASQKYSVIGHPTGRLLVIDGCEQVVVYRCNLAAGYKGVVLNNSVDVKVVDSDVRDTRTGQISCGGVSRLLIVGNRLRTSRPWGFGPGDHGDFIHIWTTAARPSCAGLLIADNLIDQDEGFPILGIFLEDDHGGGFPGAELLRNVILNGNGQGMAVSNLRGRISGNLMLQTQGTAKEGPSILLRPGSEASAVTDNIAHDVYKTLASRADTSNTILPAAPDAPERIAAARSGWLAEHRPQPKPANPVAGSLTIDGVTFDIVRRAAA